MTPHLIQNIIASYCLLILLNFAESFSTLHLKIFITILEIYRILNIKMTILTIIIHHSVPDTAQVLFITIHLLHVSELVLAYPCYA